MNDSSSTNRGQRRMPSDDQMDSLLRNFFRLEIPLEFNQPLRPNGLSIAAATTLTPVPEQHFEHPRPRSVRVFSLALSVTALALAVMVLMSGNNEPLATSGNVATGDMRPSATTPDTDQPMLVSPQGDSRTSPKVVSPDGVTLEETESIELHPLNY